MAALLNKKSIILFALCSLCIYYSNAQDSIVLVDATLPQTTYLFSSMSRSEFIGTFIGDEAVISSMEKKGLKRKTKKETEKQQEYVIMTGREENNIFPFTAKFIKSKSNADEILAPDATMIYGNYRDTTGLVVDSILPYNLSEEAKMAAGSVLQHDDQYTKELIGKTVRVNDTILFDMSLPINMMNEHAEINIQFVFKLISIKKNAATFDISCGYSLIKGVEKYDLTIVGSGNGTAKYDIAKKAFTRFRLNSTMLMSADAGRFIYQANANTIVDVSLKITDNK